MNRSSRLAAAAASVVILVGCAARPTQVTTTWKEPGAGPARFRKAMAFFAGDDSTLRTRVENRLARRIPNTTASHTRVTGDQLAAADTQGIRSTLIDGGFDGAVVLRLVSVERQSPTGAAPSGATPAEDLWAYLRRTPRAAIRPGRETVVTMDARVYSLPSGKLIWSGQTQSFNPLSLGELIDMIVDASVDEMRRQGVFEVRPVAVR
jgi:hypothetical protein